MMALFLLPGLLVVVLCFFLSLQHCNAFSVISPSRGLSSKNRHCLTAQQQQQDAAAAAFGGSSAPVNAIIEQLWDYIVLAGDDLVRTRLEPRFEVFPGSLKTGQVFLFWKPTKHTLGHCSGPYTPWPGISGGKDVVWRGRTCYLLSRPAWN